MSFTYDFQIDINVVNNSHTQIIRRIPPGSRVLELGCATGYMSEFLRRELGCRVVGVEYDREAAAQAEPRCDRVIIADLEDPAWVDALGEERFDVVTCADVIEHLRSPVRLLQALPGCLEPDGVLLASIPNTAHASVRLDLLEGRLTYRDTGILDRTHLHLYTQHSLRTLFSKARYRVEELTYTFHDLADNIIRERLERLGLHPSEPTFSLLHAPDAAAYQFIVRARPLRGGEPEQEIPELDDDPLQESVEVYRNLLRQLHEVGTVAQTRETMLEERDANLARQHAALVEKDRLLSEQQAALADRDQQLTEKQREMAALIGELQASHRVVADLQGAREDLAASLEAMRNSTGWRLWQGLMLPVRAARQLSAYLGLLRSDRRRALGRFRAARFVWQAGGRAALGRRRAAAGILLGSAESPDYEAWIRQHEAFSAEHRNEMQAFLDELDRPVLISIVMPVYNAPEAWLREALDSVLSQFYPYWELCIADDASTDPRVRAVLKEYAKRDGRIKVVFRQRNGHISAASNSALELATGEYVAFMDHDDLIWQYALYFVARAIEDNPGVELIYSDEDKINRDGSRYHHYFKPDFNPDLMLSHNMICHLGVYRRDLLSRLGGLREGYEGAQDYDLALRALLQLEPEQIHHIPRILYHWRASAASTASGAEAKPYAMQAAIRAVGEYLQGRGVEATVSESPLIEGMLRVRYGLPEAPPLVSMIIPTRNGLELIRRCVDSICEKTEYRDFEILVVDNGSDDPDTLEYLRGLEAAGTVRLLHYPHPFNFSAINNFAVAHARGQVLALLNNDLEVIDPGWLGEMVSHAVRPEIGAVGACLWYPDDRLQHGGVVLGLGGVAGHAMKMLPRGAKGYNARAVLVQNYSAVTAACMLVRRGVFDEVGGFDADNLPIAFNDVDLCLRIREKGYRNLWTPYAQLYHHESASRGAEDTPDKQARFEKEINYMRQRWGQLLRRDPAYNPNLTDRTEDFALRT